VEVGEGEGESGGGPSLSVPVGGQCFFGLLHGPRSYFRTRLYLAWIRDVVSPPMIDCILLFTFACAEERTAVSNFG
jgi:hypothetical protein